jgi:hypothetical protein
MTKEERHRLRLLAEAARDAELAADWKPEDYPLNYEAIDAACARRAETALELRKALGHATVTGLLDDLDAAEVGLAQAWEDGRKPKPTEKVCTLCRGDWEGDRMSCMGCHRGIVYGPPVNPYAKKE